MDCSATGTVRCCSNKLRRHEFEGVSFRSCNVPFSRKLVVAESLSFLHHSSFNGLERYIFSKPVPKCQLYWRQKQAWSTFTSAISMESEISLEGDKISREVKSISDETSEMLGADELKSLLVDTERRRLVKKLSEANQHNRYLKRQLQSKDDDLVNLKSDLAMLELELQTLVGLAEEVANFGVMPGTRKINGKYIQSHLLYRLEAASEKLKQHIKGVDLIKFQEINLLWIGMAESVQVMGSFDGWSEGEDMSPEYDGIYPRFSTTLKLKPGRYEIKFLVDGEWQLSPKLPTVGEGLMQNNLLVVQ